MNPVGAPSRHAGPMRTSPAGRPNDAAARGTLAVQWPAFNATSEARMDQGDAHYVHGTDPSEQRRLSLLNDLLNATSLEALALRGGECVLDVGSGLGQLTRALARAGARRVVGVERDAEQLASAQRQAGAHSETQSVEFRAGDARKLPLTQDEWGSFDIVHARFVLEHVRDPLEVLRGMVRAARPGGRIVLEDDDHDVLRLWPEPSGVLEAWRAYFTTYEKRGKDPALGRRLIALLHAAGARPIANRCLSFGACAGSPQFSGIVDNFIGVLRGAREEIVSLGLLDNARLQAALESFREWSARPDAALWYTTCWAEGRSPSATERRP